MIFVVNKKWLFLYPIQCKTKISKRLPTYQSFHNNITLLMCNLSTKVYYIKNIFQQICIFAKKTLYYIMLNLFNFEILFDISHLYNFKTIKL